MNTNDMIARLARDARPVAPLAPPHVRAAIWLIGTVVYLCALALIMTSSADLTANGTAWRFVFPQLAAVATGVVAAAAAFASVVPGTPARLLLWPAAAVIVWFGSLFLWALTEWSQTGPVPLGMSREWTCVATIVFGGALPAWGMALMLRRGAPLTPRITTVLAVLSASGLANVTACLSHPHPSSVLTLAWHGGTIATLVALAAWAGRRVIAWEYLSSRASSAQ